MKRFIAVLVALVLLLVLAASSVYAAPPADKGKGLETAIAAQERHNPGLFAFSDVIGTAVSPNENGQAVIKIFTDEPAPQGLPSSLDGVPVMVEYTGKFYTMEINPKVGKTSTSVSTTGYWSPTIPIGVSTGNAGEISAGTIGARVKIGGTTYALSNNHVFALENTAAIGSTTMQPGRYDIPGYSTDAKYRLGSLYNFNTISFSTNNTIDAALSTIDNGYGRTLGKATPSNGYGTPSSTVKAAALNMAVQKYGRTTQLTKGIISAVNGTIKVSYTNGTATFTNQIFVSGKGAFIKAGDSGSLLVTNDSNCYPVGLLFAGNSSGNLAIANPISSVLSYFGNAAIDGK